MAVPFAVITQPMKKYYHAACLISLVLATTIWVSTAAAQNLDLAGATQTLKLEFPAMPAWRKGMAPWPPAAKPFDSSDFTLNASLFGGLRASYSKSASATWYPAWASLNNEQEAYPDADAMSDLGISPFSVSRGILSITATPISASAAATLPADMPRSYLSGALNTYPYGQTYGYFEINAQVPSGTGLWPAFWLLSVDDHWPPEIDAPEILGNNASTAYFSLHTTDQAWVAAQPDGYGGTTATTTAKASNDLSKDFHRYGVDWGPTTITFYIDGVSVGSRTTPSDMHKPFYLIANLAVGGTGSWPGPPNAATVFPATLRIRDIKVWQRAAYEQTSAQGR